MVSRANHSCLLANYDWHYSFGHEILNRGLAKFVPNHSSYELKLFELILIFMVQRGLHNVGYFVLEDQIFFTLVYLEPLEAGQLPGLRDRCEQEDISFKSDQVIFELYQLELE